MEFGNGTNHIFDGKIGQLIEPERTREDVDICGMHPNLCGMEAGCYSEGNTYICLCADLKRAGPNNSCDRSRDVTMSSSTVSSITDGPIQIAPTEGAFGSEQLLGMLAPSKFIPDTIADTNLTQPSNSSSTTISSPQSTANYRGPPTVILGCLLAIFVLCLVSALVFLYQKRKGGNFLWWFSGRGRSAAAMSLSKCMQQYISNPNYYTNSPDSSLLRALKDLEISNDSVVLQEEIGEGCFGKVHRGLYAESSGVSLPVAVKILKQHASPEAQTDFEREVEIMSAFRHENILRLLGIVIRDNESAPWMIFEYMQYGDLAQLLRSNSPLLPIPATRIIHLNPIDLISISSQIASGMVYLSSQHFVHRDLATRNCLVGDNLVVKISDFGMSRDIYTSDYYKVGGSRMLPIRWMAPESITYGKFSLESDVWAFGVVLWEIFTYAKQPYYGHSNDEVVKLILQGILLASPENCPQFVVNIMAGCWKTEPRDRLSFPEIYEMLLPNTPDRPQPPLPSDEAEDAVIDSENYLVPTAITVI